MGDEHESPGKEIARDASRFVFKLVRRAFALGVEHGKNEEANAIESWLRTATLPERLTTPQEVLDWVADCIDTGEHER